MTDNTNDELNKEILAALQRGLPIEPHPFKSLASDIGISEDEVVAFTQQLFTDGKARRCGAVFDSAALGYQGTLCGVAVPEDELERCAAIVSEHPGVTHCYEREHMPNMWFTMTALNGQLEDELAKMSEKLTPYEVLNLPAIKKFKIQVVFDTTKNAKDTSPAPAPAGTADVCTLQPGDKELIRLVQGNIPVSREPFAWVASQLECDIDEVISSLQRLKAAKALKRVCVILRHRKIGYVANGMCTWKVDTNDAQRAGDLLAECREVTHCYEREFYPAFPYNLFAMIHSASREDAMQVFEKISKHAGLEGGHVLFSTREFKKASMAYFSEQTKG